MEKIYQMEYRGLNLFDEISTVELAIDEEGQTIHILMLDKLLVLLLILMFRLTSYQMVL